MSQNCIFLFLSMVHWHKLPVEALTIAFKAIPDVKQVAECRLVCKAWDPVAERAMFGNTLRIKSIDKLTEITEHLAKKPSLGPSICHIAFGGDYDNKFDGNYNMEDTQLIKKFLRLAFTPNIKAVQEHSLNKELIEHMIEIARQSRTKFDKLENLPLSCYSIEDIHVKIMYQFRESLKKLELTLSEGDPPVKFLLDHLEEFGNLTKLTLYIKKKTSLKELEDILTKCHQLKEICAGMEHDNGLLINTAELKTWLAKKAKKNADVYTIQLAFGVCPGVVDYLYYKYPNVSRAAVRNPSINSVKRMVATIKAIDYVKAE